MIWELAGHSAPQREIIESALSKCDFPWDVLYEGLKAQTGRDQIPVGWKDLSRWYDRPAVAATPRAQGAPDHNLHSHSHENYHAIEHRGRVLGLAWYDGRVDVDASLVNEPALAQEVFLAEGAHMVDFFWMSQTEREQIFAIFHHGDTTPHDHGWFEETGNNDYWSWVGESFMGGFMQAFSSIRSTLGGFTHVISDLEAKQIRQVLLARVPAKVPPTPSYEVFGTVKGITFHDQHKGVKRQVVWSSAEEARRAGRVPCKTCKPDKASPVAPVSTPQPTLFLKGGSSLFQI